MEAARRRGADDYARDAANRRQLAREAGIDNQDDDDGDNGDATDEIRREKERRELEMKLMTLSAGAKVGFVRACLLTIDCVYNLQNQGCCK